MIGSRKPILIEVTAGNGAVTSEEAISLGLITTELVINALKHAFPNNRKGKVTVAYTSKGSAWTLSIADDGIGQPKKIDINQPGLGTGIVLALANQMNAQIKTMTNRKGTKVSIVYP